MTHFGRRLALALLAGALFALVISPARSQPVEDPRCPLAMVLVQDQDEPGDQDEIEQATGAGQSPADQADHEAQARQDGCDAEPDGVGLTEPDRPLPALPALPAQPAPPALPTPRPAPKATAPNTQLVRMRVTAYCACTKCCGRNAKGITASGKHVSANGSKFVAADTRLLPFQTKVSIPGYNGGAAVPVLDTGSAIKGRRLDVYFASHSQAQQWGSRWLTVKVQK